MLQRSISEPWIGVRPGRIWSRSSRGVVGPVRRELLSSPGLTRLWSRLCATRGSAICCLHPPASNGQLTTMHVGALIGDLDFRRLRHGSVQKCRIRVGKTVGRKGNYDLCAVFSTTALAARRGLLSVWTPLSDAPGPMQSIGVLLEERRPEGRLCHPGYELCLALTATVPPA
jgi:hypothetical protein